MPDDTKIRKVGRANERSLYGITGSWPLAGEPDPLREQDLLRHKATHQKVEVVVTTFDAAMKAAFGNKRLTLIERDARVATAVETARAAMAGLRNDALTADSEAAELSFRMRESLLKDLDPAVKQLVWLRVGSGGRDAAHQLAQRALDNRDSAVLAALVAMPVSVGPDLLPVMQKRIEDQALSSHDPKGFKRVSDLRRVADLLSESIGEAERFIGHEANAAVGTTEDEIRARLRGLTPAG